MVSSNKITELLTPYNFDDDYLALIALEIRRGVFEICLNAQSGHIGGSSSSVELMTTLYFGGILAYDPQQPNHPYRDRVLVRGHLGPLRYKLFSILGWVQEEELSTYRQLSSRLQGHEDHLLLPGIDITPSGSLGMLLSYGAGCAISAKDLGVQFRTWVFLGDGEEQEGNISEAARHIAHLEVPNITVVLDRNQKQLSCPTSETDSANIEGIWSGYGWKVLNISNGHDIQEIRKTLKYASTVQTPVLLIANTIKGYGLDGAESHVSGYHTIGTCPQGIPERAIQDLDEKITKHSLNVSDFRAMVDSQGQGNELINTWQTFKTYEFDLAPKETDTVNLDYAQLEYYHGLKRLISDLNEDKPSFYFLTADVTYKRDIEAAHLDSFMTVINTGIREQHMIAMAHGIANTLPNARVIVNSADAFSYRALDQINAVAQGRGRIVIVSDVAGLTESRNGKTHQTAGHPGAFISMPGTRLLEPWDAVDLFNCLNWAIDQNGIVVFLRIYNSTIKSVKVNLRPIGAINYYVAYTPNEQPLLTLVGSGLTVSTCIEAAMQLTEKRLPTQVISVVDQKSLDLGFAQLFPSQKPVLTVYNGAPTILQSSVSTALLEHGTTIPSKVLGHGFEFGRSGVLPDLLNYYRLDGKGIVAEVCERFDIKFPNSHGYV